MEIKNLIQQGLKGFAEKKDSAILEEISRLSNEGHILLVMVKDTIEQEGNVLNLKGGLKLTTPKYDQLLADARELQKALKFNVSKHNEWIDKGHWCDSKRILQSVVNSARSAIETFTKKYGEG